MPGLQVLARNRLLRRHDRTAPIEAINQFRCRGLFVNVISIKRVNSARRATSSAHKAPLRIGSATEVRETNLALPEQAWELSDRVFSARPEKVAIHAPTIQHGSARRSVRSHNVVGPLEVCLSESAIKVSEQSGKGYVANAATYAPRPIILDLSTISLRRAATNAGAGERILALDVRPLRVRKGADYKIADELMIVSQAYFAKPTLATGVMPGIKNRCARDASDGRVVLHHSKTEAAGNP